MDRHMSSKPQSFREFYMPLRRLSMASAVGWPYFSSRGFSRLPPFTPMRMGILCKLHSRATVATFSGPPMLPGFMRILSAAPGGLDGELVVEVDIRDDGQGRALLYCGDGAGSVHIRHGEADYLAARGGRGAFICRSVASTSCVLVQHMD